MRVWGGGILNPITNTVANPVADPISATESPHNRDADADADPISELGADNRIHPGYVGKLRRQRHHGS